MATDTSNFNFQGIGVVNGFSIHGCMNPNTLNYNPAATVDDGSCVGIVNGCMDPLSCTGYNPLANQDDGSCEYCSCAVAGAFGCTGPSYCNYDPNALCDDGLCTGLAGCMDPTACNYDALATCDDGSCLGIFGCMDDTMFNYNSNATCDDGSCIACEYGCTDCGTIWETTNSAICPGGAATLPGSINFDPLATCDDLSCSAAIYGCTDPLANNQNSNANVDDGSCTYDVLGCTDSTANNYDAFANIDDGSCTYLGCMDDGNMPSTYSNNQGGTGSLIPGTQACNYDPWANVDDGSCYYTAPSGCNDCSGFCGSGFILGDDNPYCTFNPGCRLTNKECEAANLNRGCCCQPIQEGCMDPLAINYDCATVLHPGSTSPCTDFVNVDDGTCTYAPIPGCTDPLADNYDASATVDDGTCTYDIYGCADSVACNYNPLATIDDGSCAYGLAGCSDPLATNYDASIQAECDDGSCIYPPGCTVTSGGISYLSVRIDPNTSYGVSAAAGYTFGDAIIIQNQSIVGIPTCAQPIEQFFESKIDSGITTSIINTTMYDYYVDNGLTGENIGKYYATETHVFPSNPHYCSTPVNLGVNQHQYCQLITFGALGGTNNYYPQTIERSWESHWTSDNTINDVIAWLNANVEPGFTNTMSLTDVNVKLQVSSGGVNPKILRAAMSNMRDCAAASCTSNC